MELAWTCVEKKMMTASLNRCYSGHYKATGRRRPRNTWKRDLEKEMWTAGYKYSWMKMEAAAPDRAG